MSTKSGIDAAAPTLAEPPKQTGPRPAPAAASLTPAMRQYLEQKARVGDAILLFRMGDFYETFFDDARTIARVLGLTLTARDKRSEQPIPLAGVPYHALDRYVARLVRAGYKVAISEQLEDPSQAQGVVKRDVVRIITPGTLTDSALLDDQAENLLVALCPAEPERTGRNAPPEGGDFGLACVELASGRFFAQVLPFRELIDELARLRPAEVLMPEATIDQAGSLVEQLREGLSAAITFRPPHVFDRHMAERSLLDHFKLASLAGFGFDRFDSSLCAAAAVLDYLRETQRGSLDHILRITPRLTSDSVLIDQATLRSLEVDRTLRDGSREGSLLASVDRTVNPMGARRLREWLCFPLREVSAVLPRQQAIADLLSRPDKLASLRKLLREMGDVERICARLGVGRASPRDLVGLGRALALCGDIAAILEDPDGTRKSDGLLAEIAASATGYSELAAFLGSALVEDAPPVTRDGGFIADGFHAELDRLRILHRDGHRTLAEFQAREAQRTGIPNLRIDYNSVFGYYIEITHQHREKVPPEYVRRQTVRNAERYITDELKQVEREMTGAQERAKALELELFEQIRARAIQELARMQRTAASLATLDGLAALAELARQRNYCRPEFVEPEVATDKTSPEHLAAAVLEIVDGRHPVLESLLAERFVPNDCRLSAKGDRLLIITGPNMAGKSTYIRQVALLTLLAHTGSYVPAKSMRLSPVDRIFARVGAADELTRGHSTFMVEMVETARILHNATAESLVILDEIGRGTSTYDGLAIAWAVTEYLAETVGCRVLFATHYHELTDLGGKLPGVANCNVAVKEQLRPEGTGRDVVFLHKIVPGPTDRSYGIHVAEMAGLPRRVVRRSEAVLAELERSFSRRFRDRASRVVKDGAEDQPLLFSLAEPLPAWWRELVDALHAIDVDRTTPLEALGILGRLKAMARDQSTDSPSR